ncbi:MAG: hypothetical protein ACTS42_00795 [Candidatus Hodgkinia cicadicola]
MRQKTETNGKWGRLIQRFDFVGNERPLRGGISEELKWDELLKKLFYCFDSLSYEMFFLRRVERGSSLFIRNGSGWSGLSVSGSLRRRIAVMERDETSFLPLVTASELNYRALPFDKAPNLKLQEVKKLVWTFRWLNYGNCIV